MLGLQLSQALTWAEGSTFKLSHRAVGRSHFFMGYWTKSVGVFFTSKLTHGEKGREESPECPRWKPQPY